MVHSTPHEREATLYERKLRNTGVKTSIVRRSLVIVLCPINIFDTNYNEIFWLEAVHFHLTCVSALPGNTFIPYNVTVSVLSKKSSECSLNYELQLQITELINNYKKKLLSEMSTISCVRHNDREASLYCMSCNSPICSACTLSTHFDHDRQEFDEFVEQRRRQLRDHIVDVELHQRQVDDEVDRARRASTKLIRNTLLYVQTCSTFRLTGWRKKTGPRYLIANILKIP